MGEPLMDPLIAGALGLLLIMFALAFVSLK